MTVNWIDFENFTAFRLDEALIVGLLFAGVVALAILSRRSRQ